MKLFGMSSVAFGRQAAWRLGAIFVGPCRQAAWRHGAVLHGFGATLTRASQVGDWANCVSFLYQGETFWWLALKAWVVKLLGGPNVRGRQIRRMTGTSAVHRELYEKNVVGAQETWVVKLLGGLSASAVHKELLKVHTF